MGNGIFCKDRRGKKGFNYEGIDYGEYRNSIKLVDEYGVWEFTKIVNFSGSESSCIEDERSKVEKWIE